MRLAELEERLARAGGAVPPSAARWLGHRVAHHLADAHAALDPEGDLEPMIHGALTSRAISIDGDGEVTIVLRDPAEPSLEPRLTPRTDVLGLGLVLARLFHAHRDESGDAELEAALATAVEPLVAKRRVTCVELEALLARGADMAAGRAQLAELVASVDEPRAPARAPAPATRGRGASRPLPPLVRVAIALATASAVYTLGVQLVERWLL